METNSFKFIFFIFFMGMLTGLSICSFYVIFEDRILKISHSYLMPTGSMLPSLNPDTYISIEKLNPNEPLKCGHVYSYYFNSTHPRIMHRLVYEDMNGNYYFKGDNNVNWDYPPVSRDKVKFELIGAKWK